jgi:hypothetical protein
MSTTCPESVDHRHSIETKDGYCLWCKQRVCRPAPMPKLERNYPTTLESAYRYHYDPDEGGHNGSYYAY